MGARSADVQATLMVKKEELIFSEHAELEALEDGISKSEIEEAIARGAKMRQNGHFITIYKYFTVVYRKLPHRRCRIITVFAGYPRTWKKE